MEKVLERGAQLANIAALFPAAYCAYGTYVLLHSSSLPAQTTTGNSAGTPLFNPVGLYISFGVFVLLAAIGGVLNLISRRNAVVTENKPEPKLKIIRALYGVPGRDVDITQKLRSEVRDALFVFVDNNLVPYDPVVGVRKRLMVEYSYGNGIVECAVRPESTPWEAVSLTIPEDSQTKSLQLALTQKHTETEKPQTAKDAKKYLRDRTFAMADELNDFLNKHGPRPDEYQIPIKDKAEFTRIYNNTVQPWDDKFQADYWKNYHNRVVELRHDLAIQSVTSEALDKRLNEAQTGSLGAVTVREIVNSLRLLAARL